MPWSVSSVLFLGEGLVIFCNYQFLLHNKIFKILRLGFGFLNNLFVKFRDIRRILFTVPLESAIHGGFSFSEINVHRYSMLKIISYLSYQLNRSMNSRWKLKQFLITNLDCNSRWLNVFFYFIKINLHIRDISILIEEKRKKL